MISKGSINTSKNNLSPYIIKNLTNSTESITTCNQTEYDVRA